MAGSKLNAEIVLGGKVDGSINSIQGALGKVGNWLDSAGSKVAGVGMAISTLSVPLIAAGKQIDELFTDFDDAKLWVKAIGDYSDAQMTQIEKVTREYGRNTRFTATEVMGAYGLLEQAGYKMEESFALLPTLLNTASAGQITLADTSSLLVSNLKATGTPLEEAASYMDMVGLAANKSNSDIDSLMEGMQTLGATSRMFSGGNQEVLVWLSMLQDLGYSGSEAGMHLRNSMLTLAAPTSKASKAMEAMGASAEEIAEATANAADNQALMALGASGFQVYDEATGAMRPFVDIMTDLDTVTRSMSEKDANELLSAIFPKRTLAAAGGLMGLIEQAKELDEALNGADGTIDRMATTREEGISGKKLRAKSAIEDAMLAIGEPLADTIGDVADGVKEIAIGISGMDEESLASMVDWGTALAVSGPATLLAGKAMSGFGKVLKFAASPVGGITLAALGVGSLVYIMGKAKERAIDKNLENHLGNMNVETARLAVNVERLDNGMSQTVTTMSGYQEKMVGIRQSYAGLSGELSGLLLEAFTFDVELTPEDQQRLLSLGDELYTQVVAGIGNAKEGSLDFITMLFGEDSEEGAAIAGDVNAHFASLYAEAGAIGGTLRSQMIGALQDGEINEEEREAIKATIERYNKIMAEIAAGQAEQDIATMLARGQRLGLEGLGETKEAVLEKTKAYEASLYEGLDALVGMYNLRVEKGEMTRKDADEQIRIATEQTVKTAKEKTQDSYDSLMKLYTTSFVEGYGDVLENYGIGTGGDSFAYGRHFLEVLDDKIGTKTDANGKKQITGKEDLVAYARGKNLNQFGIDVFNNDNVTTIRAMQKLYTEMEEFMSPAALAKQIEGHKTKGEKVPKHIADMYDIYTKVLGMGAILDNNEKDAEKLINLMNPDGDFYWDVLDGSDVSSGEEAEPKKKRKIDLLPPPVEAASEYDTAISEATPTVSVSVDTTAATTKISADITALSPEVNVRGRFIGMSGLPSTLSMGGMGGASTPALYAEGGRATEASIFGEAGAEWAIPEAHTGRTAELLAQATKASGFTPQDIARQGGGLSSERTYAGGAVNINNPTFYVGDQATADEVLAKLKEVVTEAMDAASREERYAYA